MFLRSTARYLCAQLLCSIGFVGELMIERACEREKEGGGRERERGGRVRERGKREGEEGERG